MEMPATLPHPPVIAFESGVSARTQFILANEAWIESLPFNGMVINFPGSWSAMSPGAQVTYADARLWLTPLKAFNAGKENYLVIENDDPGDPFDDKAWATVVRNWTVIADVAEETGFKGILFDNEEYQGRWNNFPEDYTAAEAKRGLAAYQRQASLRGKQIGKAITRVFPKAQVAVAHGPYISAAGASKQPPAINMQVGDATDHELAGPFFTGIVAGLGSGTRAIDGGELYALRSDADFAASFSYRDSVLPSVMGWPIMPHVLAKWSARVDQAHIVYTDEFPTGFTQSPKTLTSTLRNALKHSEGAVFVYTDEGQFDWFTPGKVTRPWLDSVSAVTGITVP